MISIIILAYRNPALLRLCLKSLARAMPHGEVEIIVVDNASTPETRAVVTDEFASSFPSLRLIPLKENVGYTRGVNAGLHVAQGEYLLALNHDIVMEPGAIQALADYLAQHPHVGLVGPRLINFDETHQPSAFRFFRPWTIISRRVTWLPGAQREQARSIMHDRDLTQVQEVDWVSGAAFMTTRQAIERVGMLDERLFHYFSDVDWAWRFWEQGYSVIYYPVVAMAHYLGRSSYRFGILDPFLNQATHWHIADAFRYFIVHGIGGRRPDAPPQIQPTLIPTS